MVCLDIATLQNTKLSDCERKDGPYTSVSEGSPLRRLCEIAVCFTVYEKTKTP